MTVDDTAAQLTEWLAAQITDGEDVRIEGLDRVAMGHSAETMLLTLAWRETGDARRRDVVLRLRPPFPGLLEPYDLQRQFDILRALGPTPVRAPKVYWFESSGDVLGREFYVMERLGGTVYERGVPEELEAAPERIARMSRSLVESIAAIHQVDLQATGLQFLGQGRDFLARELDRWGAEMRRVQRGPLPALERLLTELLERRPDQCSTVTLVHGDPKPGNFAFQDDEVSAVFDWEMASVGDPLADIGWAECNWTTPGSFTNRTGALTPDEAVALYQELTGITVAHREWYRAFQGYKMVVIMLVASMLFDRGFTDDLRFADMGLAVHPYTLNSLAELGIDEALEPGPVTAREERVREVRERATVPPRTQAAGT
jgi:aminoglycoside phosphotransferase (APT) family kinase protein